MLVGTPGIIVSLLLRLTSWKRTLNQKRIQCVFQGSKMKPF